MSILSMVTSMVMIVVMIVVTSMVMSMKHPTTRLMIIPFKASLTSVFHSEVARNSILQMM